MYYRDYSINSYAKGGKIAKGTKLDVGVYRVGKPTKVSPSLYEQKIVEIFKNGDIATASDYGRKLNDFKSQKYPIISKEQLDAQYKMAHGGMMANGGELRYKIKGKNFDEQIKNNREYKKLIDQVDANQNEENKFQKNFIDETARTGKIVKFKNEYHLKDYSYTGDLTSFPFLNDKDFLEAIKYLDRPTIKTIK
jgi:hypothetical protein